MILGHRKSGLWQSGQSPSSVEPRGRDETGCGNPCHVLNQFLGRRHPRQRGGMVKAEELALARRHVARAETVERTAVPAVVAMRPAVDEHFNARVGPAAQAALKAPVLGDRRAVPMIGNDQHRQLRPAKVADELVEQAIDLVGEARADVVDRGQEFARGFIGEPHD